MNGRVSVVAAENEYGNVASQIGGPFVSVSAVMRNPSTDPHTYEVSPGVAGEVSRADLIIQNGLGYDDFMTKLEAASSKSGREVINVQHLLAVPNSQPNPHLWYSPITMPRVATALAHHLAKLRPAHASYFKARAARFVKSLKPWIHALRQFKSIHPNIPVVTTEPVADYMLQAAGVHNLAPMAFQLDIMNGTDPAPQDVAGVSGLLKQHKAKVLVYNRQVTDALTQSFITAARDAKVPVVGVYETMPVPGYDYQSWMQAEVSALERAVARGASTVTL